MHCSILTGIFFNGFAIHHRVGSVRKRLPCANLTTNDSRLFSIAHEYGYGLDQKIMRRNINRARSMDLHK